jgi:hypothetical protein
MVSMSDELKERNILKLLLIMKFACDTLDVGHSIHHESTLQTPATTRVATAVKKSTGIPAVRFSHCEY